MKLSVLVPTFNEKNTIEAIIEKIRHVPYEKEIIVVDDGSTDGTKKILHLLAGKYPETTKSKIEAVLSEGKCLRTILRNKEARDFNPCKFFGVKA